ncbi:MAG: flavodoxin domain-containing protein [Ruminococcaceae bacterium]|nr:flavodoxin domain-containing protein [Oscillospiraceae bacterium]
MTIVYESNTGFTERYAKTLSEKTGIEALPLKSAKKAVPKGNDVVFLGWVFANKINGLDKARKLWNVIALAAVGMNPPTEQNNKALMDANKPECPFFYLAGGLDNSKLKGMHKMMLNMVRQSLEKENKPEYKDAIEMFKNGGDWFSEEYLSDLITLILAKL